MQGKLLNITWQPEPPSCEVCTACEMVIYSVTYRMWVDEEACELVICSDCWKSVSEGAQ